MPRPRLSDAVALVLKAGAAVALLVVPAQAQITGPPSRLPFPASYPAPRCDTDTLPMTERRASKLPGPSLAAELHRSLQGPIRTSTPGRSTWSWYLPRPTNGDSIVLTVYYGQWHQEDEFDPDGPPVWGQFVNRHHPDRGAGTRCSDCLVVEQVCRLTIAGVSTFAAVGRMNGWTRYEEVFAVVPMGLDSLLYLKVRSQPLLPVAFALSAFASVHRTPLPD